MPPKKKKKIIPKGIKIEFDDITSKMKCRLCHQSKTKDVLKSGDLYSLALDKQVYYYHYFCLLFSKHGVQNGGDDEGVIGFLPEDIEVEYKRGLKFKCYICDKVGATIECHKKCKRKYHFPCGADNPVNEHYYIFKSNIMGSFCPLHIPKQQKRNVDKDYCTECVMCLEEFEGTPGPGRDRFVCIGDTCRGVYHRICVQKIALSSGVESFKCPLCNNHTQFKAEAEKLGIYVPHAPPAWEQSDLYGWDGSQGQCDAEKCICRHGRTHNSKGSRYELYACDGCGGEKVHIECGRINKSNPSYLCGICKETEEKGESDGEEEENQYDSSSSESVDDFKVAQILQSCREEKEKEARVKAVNVSNQEEEENQTHANEEICIVEEKVDEERRKRNEERERKLEEIREALRRSPSPDVEIVAEGWPQKITTKDGEPLNVLPVPRGTENTVSGVRFGPPPQKTERKSMTNGACRLTEKSSPPLTSGRTDQTLSLIRTGPPSSSQSKAPPLPSPRTGSLMPLATSSSTTERSGILRKRLEESNKLQSLLKKSQNERSQQLSLMQSPQTEIGKCRENAPMEEIIIDSSDDEAENNQPLGIQICNVMGGDELQRDAQATLQSASSTQPTEDGFSVSEPGPPSDDDIEVVEIVLPPPVPIYSNKR